MALDALWCNHLAPLGFKGLMCYLHSLPIIFNLLYYTYSEQEN